ncbi:acyltransferase family protein [Microbacterium sp. 4R-513]|uniref:acyltransferase family protein n=1 Tax=Microbacterium sp. 4R-513 TaxID=2567934 RepID=UPI0013E19CB0|nr:acyltransferase family protein [Microbacterium sp. 4R-513]QIG38552.1 acyltransferase family protein [Microbacterium sp. 4R-513]
MRLAWADVARGGAMILVVLAHALQLMDVYGWHNAWLDTLNLYLTAVRMPLFFLVAGIFGANAIRRTWRGLFASRLALLLYMYFLWMLIRAVWFTVIPWPLSDVHPWIALALSPAWPTNGLWFLFALIVYLVVGKLTVRWPAWIPLVAAGILAVAAAMDVVPTAGNTVWRSVAMYLFFFLLGARLPDVWRAVAARANIPLLVVAIVVVPAAMAGFSFIPGIGRGVGRIGLSVVCVAACLVIAAMIAKVGWLAAPFRYIGQRTIAVYVAHAMLLAAVVPLIPVGIVPPVVAAVVFTAFGVGVPLVLYRWLGPVGGVFNLPRPWARALESRREPVS